MSALSLSFSLLAAIAAFAATAAPDWRTLTKDLACRVVVEERLVRWGAAREVLRAPDGPRGTKSYRIATGRLGVWVSLHVPGDGSPPRLFRTSAEETLRVDLVEHEGGCSAVESRPPESRLKSGDREFTDDDLEKRLQETSSLVVYLWSPHMPLSVEGYAEILAASRRLGAPLLALLHPSADEDYARRAAHAQGIPESALRKPASIELLFRELTVHAPAVLVYSSGRASAVLPGYRNRDAYEDHLARSLAGTR